MDSFSFKDLVWIYILIASIISGMYDLGRGAVDAMYIVRYIVYHLIFVPLVITGWRRPKLYRIGVAVWKIGTVLSVIDLVSLLFTSEPIASRLYSIFLLFECAVAMPCWSQLGVCGSCKRRIYWRPFISNKCRRCGGEIICR